MKDIIAKPTIKKKKKENSKTLLTETGSKKSISVISWKAPEYADIPKTKDWFWAVGILTICFFVAALIMRNLLFGIFVLLAGFTIILYAHRKPRIISFEINARGIKIQNRLYPYENLKSFWLHYDPPHKKELSIESEKLFMPYIIIPLGDIDPNVVRDFLLKFLKEKEHKESLVDSIAQYLRF